MNELMGHLYENMDSSKQMLTAVSGNYVDKVGHLIQSGIDVNAEVQKQGGNTALHLAAQKGHLQCLEKLLTAGGDPDKVNNFGLSALSLALRHGHVTSVERLLTTGSSLSDPNLLWFSNMAVVTHTPLWINYNQDMIKLLIRATPNFSMVGADILSSLFQLHLCTLEKRDLLRIYLLSGNKVNSEQLGVIELNPNYPRETDQFLYFVKSYPKSVQPLQHYCRLCIRRCLKPNVFYGANKLPIPNTMKDYITLRDET